MRRFAFALLALALAVLPLDMTPAPVAILQPPERLFRVPRLPPYEDVYIKESELGRLKPLNWAMMIDMNHEQHEEVMAAFDRQCRKDPTLMGRVGDLFATKGMIDRARRDADGRFHPRQWPQPHRLSR